MLYGKTNFVFSAWVACWNYRTNLSPYFCLDVNFVCVCVSVCPPLLHGDNEGGNTLHLPCGAWREKMWRRKREKQERVESLGREESQAGREEVKGLNALTDPAEPAAIR